MAQRNLIAGYEDNPISYAQTMLFRAAKTYGVAFKDFEEVEIEDVLMANYADVKLIPESRTNPNRYYEVSERSALEIAGVAQYNHSAAMMANRIVTFNLMAEKPVPKPLLKVAIRRMWYGLIPQAYPLPKKLVSKNFVPRFYTHLVALGVAEFYHMPLTRNDGSPEHSACDVVSEASKNLGVDIPYTRLRDWCTHRDGKALRETSEIIASIIDTGRFATKDGLDLTSI